MVANPLTLWHAVKRFRELVLTIREDDANGITTVSIEWTDPAVAARWANDYVALANEHNSDSSPRGVGTQYRVPQQAD